LRKVSIVALFIVSLLTANSQGVQETAPSESIVQIADHQSFGPYLTDANGLSLYVFRTDAEAEGGTACLDRCAENWPPLLLSGGEVEATGGLKAELLGSFERPDGTIQATYNGWPLYRSARDQEAGQTRGQGLGNVFYLISPEGSLITEARAAEAPDVNEELFATLMSEGHPLFSRHCATCHGNEGQGLVGPALNGMRNIAGTRFIVTTILQGRTHHGMPAFAGVLNDREIAALATYVRNSWSNEFGPVVEEEVSQYR
jgi:predicted lipoprotein with Yx(FWY)xxD motif/cytochrome c5